MNTQLSLFRLFAPPAEVFQDIIQTQYVLLVASFHNNVLTRLANVFCSFVTTFSVSTPNFTFLLSQVFHIEVGDLIESSVLRHYNVMEKQIFSRKKKHV